MPRDQLGGGHVGPGDKDTELDCMGGSRNGLTGTDELALSVET